MRPGHKQETKMNMGTSLLNKNITAIVKCQQVLVALIIANFEYLLNFQVFNAPSVSTQSIS